MWCVIFYGIIYMPNETTGADSTETSSSHFPLEKVGGRKFFLTILIVAITSIALFAKSLTPEIYQYVIYMVMVIYVGGNVVQKYISK